MWHKNIEVHDVLIVRIGVTFVTETFDHKEVVMIRQMELFGTQAKDIKVSPPVVSRETHLPQLEPEPEQDDEDVKSILNTVMKLLIDKNCSELELVGGKNYYNLAVKAEASNKCYRFVKECSNGGVLVATSTDLFGVFAVFAKLGFVTIKQKGSGPAVENAGLNDRAIQDILRRITDGHPHDEIAEDYGISEARISKIHKKFFDTGDRQLPVRQKSARLTIFQKQKMKCMRKKGHSVKSIAKSVGCSTGTVYKVTGGKKGLASEVANNNLKFG